MSEICHTGVNARYVLLKRFSSEDAPAMLSARFRVSHLSSARRCANSRASNQHTRAPCTRGARFLARA
eukprot:3116375-Pleurochrysis_carterae.AAC.1